MSNEYSMELASRTPGFAPIIIVGALMGGVQDIHSMEVDPKSYDAKLVAPYVDATDGTYAGASDYFLAENIQRQHEGYVKKLFDKFAAEQTSLGAEFEEVLQNNLWNMYTRS
ncbi:hypothetical protein LCGC14_0617110 [marine sediment metagenome]|uniref:Uncharacterized protein n=2 Tax=root TaxID=1 RepID=A0A831R2R8_9GAMM|nr:hypothetical protein [Marinobacter antarcticus]HEA50959.1 hypothetical protein [Marinobacter antarcticus]